MDPWLIGIFIIYIAVCFTPFLVSLYKADFKRLKQLRKESDIEIGLPVDADYLRFTIVDYLIIKLKSLFGDKSG